ncbi:MAG: hypothetical protein WCO28_02950 [Bacteroidota bacterium]
MDIFTQKRFLVRTVIVLIIINFSTIGILFWKNISHNHEPDLFPKSDYRDVSGILKKELNLNDNQAEQIKQLRIDFFEKEKVIAKTIRSQKDSINKEMFNANTNDDLIKCIAIRVADNDFKMEMLRYEQSQKLKTICTPEQLEKFDALVLQIRDYFRPDNQPKQK